MSFDLRIDVDPVVICPYDPHHKIARSRIQRHLVKCEKNFPPDYKKQCPYDATHRVFEHELSDHVSSCQMKPVVPFNASEKLGILPEIEPTENSHLDENDEVWDDCVDVSNTEPAFEAIQSTTYTSSLSLRGNALIAKKYHSKLRRPFGYSESMMLDLTDDSTQDDAESVSSETGMGRGYTFKVGSNNQSARGVRGIYRRGIRGRLLR